MVAGGAGLLRPFRFLAGALMGAVVVIGLALAFVVGSKHQTDRNGNLVHTHAPGLWMYVVIVILAAVVAAIIPIVGYRIASLPSTSNASDVRATALQAYQRSMILRFALSELVVLVAIVLLFAGRSNTILPYVVAGVIAEALMAYHVWPSQRLIKRVQHRLDRAGGRSNLLNVINGAA